MRHSVILAFLLGLVVLAGCGIPVDDAAHSFVAVQQGQTPPATPGPPRDIPIYFLRNQKLVPVSREVGGSNANAAQEALAELLGGPSQQEKAAKLTSAIVAPSEITVTNSPVRGVITVALDTSFLDIQGPLLYEAYGQVVYTLTDPVLEIDKVQFVVGTERWPLVLEPSPASDPTDESGAIVSTGLVSRSNYCQIAISGCKGIPPPPTTSPSTN